jgi:uncharacterized DUF497 family protein
MPFRIRQIVWDDWNEEHLARHHVTPIEAEQVCFSDPLVMRGREGTKTLWGQSDAGRYLLVVLGERGEGIFYPVTARDMTESERRNYHQKKGR